MQKTAEELLPESADYRALPEVQIPHKKKGVEPRKISMCDILAAIELSNSKVDPGQAELAGLRSQN